MKRNSTLLYRLLRPQRNSNHTNKPNDNKPNAFRYYTLAVEQDLDHAQYRLARCYQNGKGTEKDMKLAFHYFKLAADHGLAQAQYNVGRLFHFGHGI